MGNCRTEELNLVTSIKLPKSRISNKHNSLTVVFRHELWFPLLAKSETQRDMTSSRSLLDLGVADIQCSTLIYWACIKTVSRRRVNMA